MSNYWVKYQLTSEDQVDPHPVTISFFFTGEERDRFVESCGDEIKIIKMGDSYVDKRDS